MTEKEWREHIENRRRSSDLWQFIHLCGSLRLAMVLLLTIPIACAVATIYESKFNAQVAQAYVYKAPWFVFWLMVLCINLFAVTLTRWPWRRKHIGFVLTHYGIIILLIGGVVGQKFGFEGSITLHTSAEPTRQLVINRTVLQMESGMERIAYKVPFPVNVSPPTPEKPKTVAIPHSHLKLKIDRYSEKLGEETSLAESPVPQNGPGVALEMASAMMGQSTTLNLARTPATAAANEFFGMARIEWLDALPDRSAAPPHPGAFRETQMVFARFQAVVTSQSGEPSGYRIGIALEGKEPHLLIESPDGHRDAHHLREVLGKPVTLHTGTQMVVREYWPDWKMEDGKPVTLSQEPNNPAALIALSSDGTREKPLLELAPDGNGGIAFQVSRGGVISRQGKATPGESFEPGWADWKFTLRRFIANAMIESRMLPREQEVLTPDRRDLISGIHARLVDPTSGKEGEPQWIPSGRGVTLRLAENALFLGFGLEVHPLPFTINLLKFEVPRNQGSNSPADFRSTVRFEDPVRGKTVEALIHMNHPASYPEGFWRAVVGQNYKFSQAQWNPEDLGETTLQVLHDPGWPLKWFGSLILCLGIAIMFYLKPKRETPAARTAPTPATPV